MISGLNQVFVGIRIDELTKRGEIDVLMAQKLNSIVLGLMSQGQWHPPCGVQTISRNSRHLSHPLDKTRWNSKPLLMIFVFLAIPSVCRSGALIRQLNVRFTYPCNFVPIGNFTPLENFLIVSAFVTSWVSKGPIYLDIGLHMLYGEISHQVWLYNLKHFRMS